MILRPFCRACLQLMPETLFLTTNLIDRFLELKGVSRKNLQLVRSRRPTPERRLSRGRAWTRTNLFKYPSLRNAKWQRPPALASLLCPGALAS